MTDILDISTQKNPYSFIPKSTSDAHGYILLPESWQHKTRESGLSFGGKNYGQLTEERAEALLKACKP